MALLKDSIPETCPTRSALTVSNIINALLRPVPAKENE
jgi:hypothetical protein